VNEDTLRARLREKLTEAYLRDTLEGASSEDDRGRMHTDLASAAESMADWLAQECCDDEERA
jgi:hypothetical protein